jgi:hypothetical protein
MENDRKVVEVGALRQLLAELDGKEAPKPTGP